MRRDRHVHRLAGLRARHADLGLHLRLALGGTSGRRRPVHAQRLQRLLGLFLLDSTALFDERLGLRQLLPPIGRIRLRQQIAAELDLVIDLHAVVVDGIFLVVLGRLSRLDQLAVLLLPRALFLDEAQRLVRLLRDPLPARLGLLFVARESIEEVLVVIGLAEGLGRRPEVDPVLENARRHQLDVGRDADLLDRHVPGRQVLRDGELEGALVARIAVLEVVEHLHAAFAEALAADDDRAVEVLQRARDDLGS